MRLRRDSHAKAEGGQESGCSVRTVQVKSGMGIYSCVCTMLDTRPLMKCRSGKNILDFFFYYCFFWGGNKFVSMYRPAIKKNV